jgi:hypothetical protein
MHRLAVDYNPVRAAGIAPIRVDDAERIKTIHRKGAKFAKKTFF